MGRNPAKEAGRNPQPAPRAVRAFTVAEVEAIAAELSPMYRALPAFAAATGLRPEEWQALERRDIDRARAACSTSAAPCRAARSSSLARPPAAVGRCRCRTARARGARRAPAAPRHAAPVPGAERRAAQPRQLPPPRVGDRRSRPPATARPARIYDLRSTFATDALAAGVGVHALARIMGTSVRMIERHYGTLLDGADGVDRRPGSTRSSASVTRPRPRRADDVSVTTGSRRAGAGDRADRRNRQRCRAFARVGAAGLEPATSSLSSWRSPD